MFGCIFTLSLYFWQMGFFAETGPVQIFVSNHVSPKILTYLYGKTWNIGYVLKMKQYINLRCPKREVRLSI